MDFTYCVRSQFYSYIAKERDKKSGMMLVLKHCKATPGNFLIQDHCIERSFLDRFAHMLTDKPERENEDGINKRLSTNLDWQWKKSIVVKPPPSLNKLRDQEAAEEAEKSAA